MLKLLAISNYSVFSNLLAQDAPALPTESLNQVLNYQFHGNELWRFALLLAVIIATMIVARFVRYLTNRSARKLEQKQPLKLLQLFLKCLARPLAVAIFAAGFHLARFTLKFQLTEDDVGFSLRTFELWGRISQALLALAIAYFLYRLVDIIEHYLSRWATKTETELDNMLVPIIRKGLRVFIVLLTGLFIVDNVLNQDVGTILAAAGIGGLAVALAAQETIANFFGSINIFADRPFLVGERIRINGFDGPVESVGFRSTRIRTLDGHQVSIPNSKIANEMLENIGRRPFIKRLANISITYDTPPEKVQKAVQIIKDILAQTDEVNRDPELIPRVYFNAFKDFYLNILVIYWVHPPDYWLFQQVNQNVNLAIMRAFEAEGIEFAFPTQTLYLKKDESKI